MTDFLDDALCLWGDSPSTPPANIRRVPPPDRPLREAQLDKFIASIQRELQRLPQTRAERLATHERITAAFAAFGRDSLGLEDTQLRLLLAGGLSGIATALARRARAFDPAIDLADVLQASRNAWTACGLQLLYGREMSLTPSIFAYSMLYPYSDNYLDDPSVDLEAKRGFSDRFGRRLAGDGGPPANRHETAIWRLVGLIESEYGRVQFPQVFAGLLRIHEAQSCSLRLLRRSPASGDLDVLRLGFEKGGASVLADALLAAGSLTVEQARFAYCWGVLLQLGDDLQDLREDLESGLLTLFSQAAGTQTLDQLTWRTLHFAQAVMGLMRKIPGVRNPALESLIHRSSVSLIIRSAGDASKFYSQETLSALEAQSPFRFSFLEEKRMQLANRRGLLAKLFEAFLAGDPDEPAFPWLPGSLMPRL